MKTNAFILLFFIVVIFSSCTKTTTKTVTIRDTTVVKDTITPSPSILSLLTGKDWQYDTIIYYTLNPVSGTIVYARGASNNYYNYDTYFFDWTTDGYIWTFEGLRFMYRTPWSFIGSDSTLLKLALIDDIDTSYCKILTLDNTHLTFYDSSFKRLNKYGVKIQE